jgi:hypothetical protein
MKYIITESQRHTLLVETLSPTIRRRLSFENMKDEMDSIIEYHMIPCEFRDAGSFVAEACDMFVYSYLEDLESSSKDKDGLYYYAVDVFGKYLAEIYNEKCGKKNMVTESKDNFSRKVNILKKYTENALSEKPWFNGLDITTSPYQTSHKDEKGRYYLTTIPIIIFKIDTKGLSNDFTLKVFHKLENEVEDIVVPLFTSLFEVEDDDDNLNVVWDKNFDLHL